MEAKEWRRSGRYHTDAYRQRKKEIYHNCNSSLGHYEYCPHTKEVKDALS